MRAERSQTTEAARGRATARTAVLAGEAPDGRSVGASSRYAPTVVLSQAGTDADVGTARTLAGQGLRSGALADRMTRDRIHHSLFGDLAEAPQIGRYAYLKELGEGGMGVVCAAYDPKLDRKVAIKLIRTGATVGDERRARVMREAQAMARLSHPNVVQVYEVGELHGELFVVMEFVAGGDLADWLAAADRSWREVQRVFVEAGKGLAAAHAVGLVHRDFKPANVFVGDDGRVLVGDFGLARAASIDEATPIARRLDDGDGPRLATPLTATGAILGTPAYMAPEQFERDGGDAASDQFAFCVALFEALHGARPFPSRDVTGLIHAVLHDPPTIPAGADVPGWLQRVVLRGLEKRPEDRWPSMEALLAALAFDPALRARGIRRLGLAAASVAAVALGFGWLAVDARERAEQEASAKIAAEAARDQAFDGLRVAAERNQAEASRARDALRLAALRRFDGLGAIEHVDDPTSAAALLREVERPEHLRGWRLSAVEALEEPIARVVLPGWYTVAFTPDGQRVVTQNGHESVSVLRSDGAGAPVTLGEREGASIGAVSLSPDGRRVAIGYRDGLVRVVPVDGEGEAIELRGPGDQVTDLSWRGDARQLLVNAWEKQPGATIRRSRRWDVNDPGAAWLDFPGTAAFAPAGGLVVTDANRSPLWGPPRDASLWSSDGGELAAFADAQRIEAAPSGDAALVITARALRLHGLGGAAIGPPLDHAPLLVGDEALDFARFTPDGSRVVSATTEDRMFVWDVASATLLREIVGPARPEAGMLQWGLGLAVSPDSALLARGYADRTVRVWDLDGEHAPMILRGHLHAPQALAFSPDSRTLATATLYVRGFSRTAGLQRERGDFDHTIRLWPIPAARTVQFSAYTRPTTEADIAWISHSPWTPDGRALVLTEGLTLRLVDAAGEPLAPAVTIPAHHEYLMEPIFTADGRFVIFESATHWVRWDLHDPSRIDFIAQPEREPQAAKTPREHGKGWADVSCDGAYVYYVSPAGDQVRVHAFDTHALVRQLDHDATVERVEFSPQGDRIMTVTKDRRVRVWPLVSGAAPAVFEAEGDGIVYPQWSPDGGFVALGVGTAVKDEFKFFVWRPGKPGAADLRITAPAVLPLTRVSPDGRHLAIVGRDDRLRLVTAAGELAIRELDAVDSEPGRLRFSADGAWILSQGSNAAFVWSTATGAIVRALRSPARHLSLATFDPTGKRVLLAARDGTLTIAPFDPELARADLGARLREATTYCYSYERRRVDLNEPAALAWANFAACERAHGREPGEAPAGVEL